MMAGAGPGEPEGPADPVPEGGPGQVVGGGKAVLEPELGDRDPYSELGSTGTCYDSDFGSVTTALGRGGGRGRWFRNLTHT